MKEVAVCPTCNIEKPLTEEFFYRRADTLHGWKLQCKECAKAVMAIRRQKQEVQERTRQLSRKYYHQKKETRAAKHKLYRKSNSEGIAKKKAEWVKINPDKVRAQKQRNYQANREKILERRKAYRKSNPDKVNEANRKAKAKNPKKYVVTRKRWEAKNPERLEQYRLKREKLIAEAKGGFSESDVLAKYELQGRCCYYCLKPLAYAKVEIDHKIPLSRGGTNFPANICCSCKSCNAGKKNKTVKEYKERLALRRR